MKSGLEMFIKRVRAMKVTEKEKQELKDAAVVSGATSALTLLASPIETGMLELFPLIYNVYKVARASYKRTGNKRVNRAVRRARKK